MFYYGHITQDLDLEDPEVLAKRLREEDAWIEAKQREEAKTGWLEAKLAKIVIDNIKTSKEKVKKLVRDVEAMRNLQVEYEPMELSIF